ncbi:MAG TPA: T9SS type A sorting domain-containing protein [Cyclobacteriaceae bacterium]|nr:T9SS type A sorting domain-containing protein [Cyclobacteriaceae bacterium]
MLQDNLPFSELAKFDTTAYLYYGPQNEVFSPVNSATNVTINYSSQAVIRGLTTTFKWYKNNQLVATNTTGTFTTTGVGVYYCKLTNGYFPVLTLTSAKTTIGNPGARISEDPETRVANSAPEEMTAYPNPATHSVVINLPQSPSQVVLYTTLGTPIIDRSVEGAQTTLDVSGTSPGIYILKVSSGSHTYEKRVVIQH